MNDRRKILILGNGFDLAHFLPTKYEHFITAMRAVEEASLDNSLSFDNIFYELLKENDFILAKTKEVYKTEEIEISVKNLTVLKKKLAVNVWFQYFKDYLDSGIDTWIDFEKEIKVVLDIVCSVLDKNSDKNEIIDARYYSSNLNIITTEFFEEFNTNKNHYLNVLLELDILQKIYVCEHDEDFIEINESEFNGSKVGFDYDPVNGLGGIGPTFEGLCLNDDYVKRYKGETTGIHTYKVITKLNNYLLSFIEIFSIYIELVESLVSRKSLRVPKVINNLDRIYSFSYSSTIERFYVEYDSAKLPRAAFLHGKAGKDNTIVLGIAELESKLLIDEKAYGFVKYYQKLVNDTDYQFLSGNSELIDLEGERIKTNMFGAVKPFEIYIWGHSLDSSDSDYIKEIFSFNKGNEASIYLIVYYFPSPHAQLANLISIMGKDIIEIWMKKGWLEFVEAPDIYALNNVEGYVDKLSKYSERNIFT